MHPGNWFTTIDLKDVYFHVEIAPEHRKYLRCAFQGIAYEYNRLPFGYSLSPRTFSVRPHRERGVRPHRERGVRPHRGRGVRPIEKEGRLGAQTDVPASGSF